MFILPEAVSRCSDEMSCSLYRRNKLTPTLLRQDRTVSSGCPEEPFTAAALANQPEAKKRLRLPRLGRRSITKP